MNTNMNIRILITVLLVVGVAGTALYSADKARTTGWLVEMEQINVKIENGRATTTITPNTELVHRASNGDIAVHVPNGRLVQRGRTATRWAPEGRLKATMPLRGPVGPLFTERGFNAWIEGHDYITQIDGIEIHGVATRGVRLVRDMGNGRTSETIAFYAPQLDYKMVRQITTSMVNGQVVSVFTRQAKRIELGEPDPAAFELPQGRIESDSGEVMRESFKMTTGGPTPLCLENTIESHKASYLYHHEAAKKAK